MRKRSVFAVLWILFYLVLMDLAVNIFLPYPQDPRDPKTSLLINYFEWGRSTEGKLKRMTRPTDAASAPIVNGGWLEDVRYGGFPSRKREKGQKTHITIFGMSHAKLLGDDMRTLRPDYVIRDMSAPAAVPTRSFSAYEVDRKRTRSDVALLAIMTDAVPLLLTTSGATSYFDSAYPYTYARYEVKNNMLFSSYPPFVSKTGYREYFSDPAKWTEYRAWLAKYDKYYDPILFNYTPLDRSAIVRVLRRAYAETIRKNRAAQVYGENGFNERSEEVIVLRAVIAEFARLARRDGTIPVVYIVNLPYRKDHLYRTLKPVLDAYSIPYLSTHVICPPDDPSIFQPRDTHFIPSKNVELAQAMIEIIEREKRSGAYAPARRQTVAGHRSDARPSARSGARAAF